MGPTDRKPQFCIAVCKTTDLQGPLYLNNNKFWTKALSGHPSSEAKPKAKPKAKPAAAGAAKSGTPAPSDDEDDDDDGP